MNRSKEGTYGVGEARSAAVLYYGKILPWVVNVGVTSSLSLSACFS